MCLTQYWILERHKKRHSLRCYFYLRHVDATYGQGLESDENGAIFVTLSTLQHNVEAISAALDEMRILKRKR